MNLDVTKFSIGGVGSLALLQESEATPPPVSSSSIDLTLFTVGATDFLGDSKDSHFDWDTN